MKQEWLESKFKDPIIGFPVRLLKIRTNDCVGKFDVVDYRIMVTGNFLGKDRYEDGD